MKKLLLALVIAVVPTMGPTMAMAQHRGAGHVGSGWHGGGGGWHQGGGHWRNGVWIPFAIGGAIVGGAVATGCWRWVVDEWGYQRRVWAC